MELSHSHPNVECQQKAPQQVTPWGWAKNRRTNSWKEREDREQGTRGCRLGPYRDTVNGRYGQRGGDSI